MGALDIACSVCCAVNSYAQGRTAARMEQFSYVAPDGTVAMVMAPNRIQAVVQIAMQTNNFRLLELAECVCAVSPHAVFHGACVYGTAPADGSLCVAATWSWNRFTAPTPSFHRGQKWQRCSLLTPALRLLAPQHQRLRTRPQLPPTQPHQVLTCPRPRHRVHQRRPLALALVLVQARRWTRPTPTLPHSVPLTRPPCQPSRPQARRPLPPRKLPPQQLPRCHAAPTKRWQRQQLQQRLRRTRMVMQRAARERSKRAFLMGMMTGLIPLHPHSNLSQRRPQCSRSQT